MLRHFAGYRFEQRLTVGSDDDYVLVFARNSDRRIAAWTASTGNHSVTIPGVDGVYGPDGEFTITNVKGEDTGRLRVNQGKLSVSLTSAPVYLKSVPGAVATGGTHASGVLASPSDARDFVGKQEN
jgi:hypothetical protein